ncbi:hypothetical protein [Haloferax marisrubri]|uniref:DUF8059 domain-containing protein n=1 Tax=Haloferax marisrubri TaxID=1544719 RepID=A0A2P4NUB2_9EURY|nr:hypothetical protein AUR65_002190 [Haloferax marisrubri]
MCMSRILKTSGFLGLATMMVVGLYQYTLLESGGVPSWLVGGHAHLGVLSILAVVMGFAVDAFALTGRLRAAVSGLFVVGQWLLPLTIWVGVGFGLMFLIPTTFLWGVCLIVSMLIMAWQAWVSEPTTPGGMPGPASPADD